MKHHKKSMKHHKKSKKHQKKSMKRNSRKGGATQMPEQQAMEEQETGTGFTLNNEELTRWLSTHDTELSMDKGNLERKEEKN